MEADTQSDEEEAFYLRGKLDRRHGISWEDGLIAYINERQSSPEKQALWQAVETMARILEGLLPFSDIEELTRLYRRAFGTHRQNISLFYHMGYDNAGC